MNPSEPSEERIERAASAIHYLVAADETRRRLARDILIADAPALVDARIAGMREATAIIRGNVILYQGDETKLRPRPDGEVSNLAYADAIDARIASLQRGQANVRIDVRLLPLPGEVEKIAKIIDPEAWGLPNNIEDETITDRDEARDRARLIIAAFAAEIATLRNDLTQRAKLIAARDNEIVMLWAAVDRLP